MRYYELLVASTAYHSQAPLTYSSEKELDPLTVVTVGLRQRSATGFVLEEVKKPSFSVKAHKKRSE